MTAARGGEYASYAEISIRRVITRDADSTYYLNGTRCRRRDVIDLFLGTGLGPRSYSIIGQNMISRVIEAKPDDMRVYLEEAAGISKYKERRRETENRIQHTKENLARLNDIRAELDKQLGHLKRQASSAEKYKMLQEQQRWIRAQYYAIQWRQLDAHRVDYSMQIQQQETGFEACQSELVESDLALENRRSDVRLATESYQEVQKRYYLSGNDITRLEQDIRHTEERLHQLEHDVAEVEKDRQQVQEDYEQSDDESKDLAQEIIELEPVLEEVKKLAAELMTERNQSENAMQQWQEGWDTFNQTISKAMQTAQVEQTRIQHLDERLASLKQRQSKLAAEAGQINFSELEQEQAVLTEQSEAVLEESELNQQQLNVALSAISNAKVELQETDRELNQLRHQLQQLHGEQASQQSLQETALGQRDQRTSEWLTKHKLDQSPRLAQGIEVENGWELAVEKVLGSYLQAVCVDDANQVTSYFSDLEDGNITLYVSKPSATTAGSKGASLLTKVKSKWPLDSLLSQVYIAESLNDAIQLSAKLGPEESVITRDGIWLSYHWLKVMREKNPEQGIFAREQELKKINQTISELTQKEETLENHLQDTRQKLQDLEKQREEFQKTANQIQARISEVSASQKIKQAKLNELKTNSERFKKEQQEVIAQLEQAESELQQARSKWQAALSDGEKSNENKETLLQQRDQLREKLQQCRDQLNQAQLQVQSTEIRLQTAKSQQASLRQNLNRLQTQLTALTERKAVVDKELENAKSTESLKEALSNALNHRLQIEEELQAKRVTVEAVDQEIRAIETRRQEIEKEINKFRDRLEQLRMESQSLKVKSENIIEKMQATNYILEDTLKELPPTAAPEEWQGQLEQIEQRISRLGAINLVAIEEYEACGERKQYLDKQNDDLQQALNMLEEAIAKIDRETRARFKETFDFVNQRFQELFPKVFGGGKAYLELTEENLLDAGVVVMACPPGKRNSTIHLLSGGEKALTAIALVFSIFHLNPAPFCLLDEVDAPLDDMNVGRFCQLVKDMAEKTQFLFISHNKLAIEMAEHLVGVTMNEPGVSRLVSVNIQEAIQMAGA